MIICRTPFRISFFGGGTDYPEWYKNNEGRVISTTINKYSYINCRYLPPFFDYKFRIRYFKREETQIINEIKHPSVRECLNFLKFKKGVDIVHNADLPARSGLGSSSTFTVGLLHALYSLKNEMVAKKKLANEAIHVEQNLIQENVGSQDQTAAAFGLGSYRDSLPAAPAESRALEQLPAMLQRHQYARQIPQPEPLGRSIASRAGRFQKRPTRAACV